MWAHIQEGAGLCGDRAALDAVRLVPRALASMKDGGTAIELFGVRHASPIIAAPLAFARIAHPDGERAIAQAAAAMEIGIALSTLSSVTLEEVASARRAAATQLGTAPAPLWFQLYLQPQRDDSLALVRRAEDAGYGAIVLTIDAGVKRSGFTLPPGVTAANLAGAAPARQTAAAGGHILFGTPLLDAVPTWDDVAWLRGATSLPVIVKGMVVGEDLDRLVGEGVDALALSTHGGRVLDALPSAFEVLPMVRERLGNRLPLLVDGGVGGGVDVVRALCMGASAVLVGRPLLHALAVAGLPGVAHALHLLRAETEAAMAQIGCASIADLTPARLWRR